VPVQGDAREDSISHCLIEPTWQTLVATCPPFFFPLKFFAVVVVAVGGVCAEMLRSLSTLPRPPAPPSSFPTGLDPNGARPGDRNRTRVESNTRRGPRVDMNFEQALKAGGTMVIKEGVDVDSLGELEDSPVAVKLQTCSSSSTSSSSTLSPPTSSRPQSVIQPAVNPAMSSSASTQLKGSLPSSSCRPPASVSTSASSSSNDLFYDAEDPEYQTRRRSMYRSQGTASSPDLATLVRKAKQRGTVLPSQLVTKDKRQESAPPLPAGLHAPSDPAPRTRQRSSTSSSGYSVPASTAMSKAKVPKSMQSAAPSGGGADWVLTSPTRDDGTVKASVESCPAPRGILMTTQNSKSSVRQKTSAFLGRFLGQNTMRERSVRRLFKPHSLRFDTSSYRKLMRPLHHGE
jgi:hypothetical protein